MGDVIPFRRSRTPVVEHQVELLWYPDEERMIEFPPEIHTSVCGKYMRSFGIVTRLPERTHDT